MITSLCLLTGRGSRTGPRRVTCGPFPRLESIERMKGKLGVDGVENKNRLRFTAGRREKNEWEEGHDWVVYWG